MSSQNSLMKSGTRVYVLAEVGRQYVIYTAVGRKFSIDMASGNYTVQRFDPGTGEYAELEDVTGGGGCAI